MKLTVIAIVEGDISEDARLDSQADVEEALVKEYDYTVKDINSYVENEE